MSGWQVERLSPALGAEVCGLDLGEVNAAEIDAIKALLTEHMVLFFPDQHLDIDAHVAFGRHFGRLESHPNLENAFTDHPEIFELAASQGGVADEWHTDITFEAEPALISILNMKRCPPLGGDTLWSNLCAAYDGLSEPMRDLLDNLTALHDARPHNRPDRMAIHPVVRVHPESGRKALYVNEHFTRRIVEMSAAESDVLLGFLTRWVQSPRFTVRYRWREGTIGMWDNRVTQHFVLDDFEGERVIQRVTVMGDRPAGVKAPPYRPWTRQRPSAASHLDRQLHRFLGLRDSESQLTRADKARRPPANDPEG